MPQPAEGVTYAPKLTREDGRIDWTREAAAIERQVRAFDPWPGTFTSMQGSVLKVLVAELAEGAGAPGTVLDEHLTIACGAGALRLTRVQLGGRAAMPAEAFLRGHRIAVGSVLGGERADEWRLPMAHRHGRRRPTIHDCRWCRSEVVDGLPSPTMTTIDRRLVWPGKSMSALADGPSNRGVGCSTRTDCRTNANSNSPAAS